MKLKLKEILQAISLGRDYYIQLPAAAKLEGMTRALSEDERLALSYLHAAMNILNRKSMLVASDLAIELEISDSDSIAEDSESDSGLE